MPEGYELFSSTQAVAALAYGVLASLCQYRFSPSPLPLECTRSPEEPYVEASWVHNTRALGTSMNGVTIHQAGTRNAGELKLGVDATLNANVNLWGGVAQQLSSHSYSDTSAIAGVKVSF